MITNKFSHFELARFTLRLQAREETSLPPFLGSTLRGAFGHSLKGAVCVMHHRDCARCLVAEKCIYPYLFETPAPPDLALTRGQQVPHPFILDPPAPRFANGVLQRMRLSEGEEIPFGLVLMGRAIEYLPYVVYAVSEMAQRGLGAGRTGFQLVSVVARTGDGSDGEIYSREAQRLAPATRATRSLADIVHARIAELPPDETIRLRFSTPTRIRVEGDLQHGMSFELLVRNILRRISLLSAVHCGHTLELDYRELIAKAAEVETTSAALRWWDWERYSNRQGTKMKLGGFVGEVTYRGPAVAELRPLVAAGEWLHLGAGTSFGLGAYQIIP